MHHFMCGSGARWCGADVICDVADMHVLDVDVDDQQRLVLTVDSGQLQHGCPCGVLAVGHGRRIRVLHDAPCFGRVTLVAVAGADLALPRAGLSDEHVQRGARSGAAADGVDGPLGPLSGRRVEL